MKCEFIHKHLSAFQDGELRPELRHEFENHLEQCAACSRELIELQNLTSALRLLSKITPSLPFPAQVMSWIRPRPRPGRRWLPAIVYTAIFAVVFSLSILFIPKENQTRYAPQNKEYAMTSVLLESQQMQLLSVQDQSIRILEGQSGE